MTVLVDGTVPIAADFNGNYTALNQVCGTTTAITGYTAGDTLYASATTALSKLPIAGNGQVIGAAAGLPAWSGHLQQIGARLSRTDATHIALGVGVIPLKVGSNWTLRALSAAVSVDTTGLSASTTYFVYAVDSSGSTVLELSATGHSTDTTWGIETKTGDALRTLVGMVRTNGSTQFQDDNSLRGVISYFNRKNISLVTSYTANRNTTSTTYVELNTEIRGNFLTWGDESVYVAVNGVCFISTALATISGAISIDSTTSQDGSAMSSMTPPTVGGACSLSLMLQKIYSEGFHFATLLAATQNAADAANFSGGAPSGSTVTNCTTLVVRVRG